MQMCALIYASRKLACWTQSNITNTVWRSVNSSANETLCCYLIRPIAAGIRGCLGWVPSIDLRLTLWLNFLRGGKLAFCVSPSPPIPLLDVTTSNGLLVDSLVEMQAILVELIETFEFSLPGDDIEIQRVSAGIMVPMVRGRMHEGTQMPLRVSLIRWWALKMVRKPIHVTI